MKKILSILIILLTFVMLSTVVSAFGVATPYWEGHPSGDGGWIGGNPLYLQPGETKTFELSVQNSDSDSNITFSVELVSGEEVINTSEDIYFLEPHSGKGHAVTATMPLNASHGDTYSAGILFKEVTAGGGIGIGVGISISFPVIAYAPDADSDGILDFEDNCPNTPNPDQSNSDGDSLGDACDNCPAISNLGQEDLDSNSIGDACEVNLCGETDTVDILSYWLADGSTEDYVGENQGILLGTAGFASGIINQAFDFTIVGDGVEVPLTNGSALKESFRDTGTLEFWVYPKVDWDSSGYVIISYLGDSVQAPDDNQWLFYKDGSHSTFARLRLDIPGGQLPDFNHRYGEIYSAPLDWSEDWYHIVLTWKDYETNNSKIEFYRNTQLLKEPTRETAARDFISLFLGAGIPKTNPNFKIDEIAVYDRVLSKDEIQVHYDRTKAGMQYCSNEVTCFGVDSQDPNVCSGFGECVDQDLCECYPDYTGIDCSEFAGIACFGIRQTDPMVCSGFGECVAQDVCECFEGHTGDDCSQIITCFGIDQMDPNVCSGFGECVAQDVCECDAEHTGLDCSELACIPEPEICDGVDNDCDGDIDEGETEIPGNSIDEDCDGVIVCDPLANWKNHGKFVSCVAKEAEALLEAGLITEEEKDAIVSEAAQSDIGKK